MTEVQAPPPALAQAETAVAQAVVDANNHDVAPSSESDPSSADTGSESADSDIEAKDLDGPPVWKDMTLEEMYVSATDVRG